VPDSVKLVKALLDIALFEDLDYTQVQAIIEIGERKTLNPGDGSASLVRSMNGL
jgi:hypothetical protein